MKDPNIRLLLQQNELFKYIDDSNTIVVEELKLPVAKAIIDIAVINGHLHGYEIKSASDTLQRLPSQLVAYSKVFDYLTVVTESKYHERIMDIIPDWVGIALCSDKKGEHEYIIKKPASFNNNKDGFFIAKLLWREELVSVLTEHEIKFNKKERAWLLCEKLSNHLHANEISHIVREKLKLRKNWKTKECCE